MEKKEILILSFTHPYGVVENFRNQISNAFECQNFKVNNLVLGYDFPDQLSKINISKISLVFSIGPYPLNINLNDVPIYEFFRCPIVMYCIDNIIYDLSRNPVCKKIFNLAKYENRIKIVLAADDHIQNLQLNNELNDFASKPIFMPMAGFFDHCLFEKPHKIKKLCVIGNPSALKVANVIIKDDMIKTAEENNFLCLSKKELSSIVDGCSHINFSGNVVNVILDRLKTKSLDLLDDNLLKFSASIDSFIRVNTRLSAIRSLIGTPIDFYGSGWDDFFPYEKNFEFKGLISHFDIPKICTKYKAVINFDPNFENGVHDRIFTSLGVGTKVITNKNIFLNNIPEYFSLIKTFDINNPDLRLIAESILMEKEEYFQNNLLFQKHSWPSRINDLLTTLRNDGVT